MSYMETADSVGSRSRILPNRPSLVDDVYDVIIEVLVSNEVEPGQPFNIEAFARELGVSPTPVREALTRIEAEGLVTKVQTRGFIASAQLTWQQVQQMTDMRRLLEPWAAAEAAETADVSDAQRLRGLAKIRPSEDMALAYRADMLRDAAFHEAIWELAGNPFIRDSLVRMHCHLHLYRLVYTENLRHASEAEHLKIADAIADGDASAAREAMLTHIDVAANRIRGQTHPSEDI